MVPNDLRLQTTSPSEPPLPASDGHLHLPGHAAPCLRLALQQNTASKRQQAEGTLITILGSGVVLQSVKCTSHAWEQASIHFGSSFLPKQTLGGKAALRCDASGSSWLRDSL